MIFARHALSVRSWLYNSRGVAAVEFAMSVPILLLMYFGSYQLSEAIAAKRKVTITARALTDITTQSTSLTHDDVDTILNASQQVMAPYPFDDGTYRISELKINSDGSGRVQWSQSLNGTARANNTVVSLPSGIGSTDNYIIMGEVNYQYNPAIVNGIVGPVNMTDVIYMSPRKSIDVPLS